MDWHYDSQDLTWKCGNQEYGAGVFIDAPLTGDEDEWYGNIVTPSEVVMIGPFGSKDAAQACAEERLSEKMLEGLTKKLDEVDITLKLADNMIKEAT